MDEVLRRFLLVGFVGAAMIMTPDLSRAEPSQFEVNAYKTADVDNDRHLNRHEFEQFVILMASAGNRNARRVRFFGAYGIAFRIADHNGDGAVSPDELIKADADH